MKIYEKLPKGQSDSQVNHWKTEIHYQKKKKHERQTMFDKALHKKQKIEEHEPH